MIILAKQICHDYTSLTTIFKDREFAENIISGCHDSWAKLMAGETPADGIVLSNTGLGNSSSIDQAASQAIIDQVEFYA